MNKVSYRMATDAYTDLILEFFKRLAMYEKLIKREIVRV